MTVIQPEFHQGTLMQMVNLVKAAMRDKAAALHQRLEAAGKLSAYASDLASQISSETVRLTQEQRRREKWDNLGAMACAAKMKMADALNQELVLRDLLEFPQEETSRPSQDETTSSVPTTSPSSISFRVKQDSIDPEFPHSF